MIKGFRATHCKRGHEFTEENTGYSSRKTRYCRTCQRLKKKDWRAKFGDKPETRRKSLLKCKYGRTPEDYNEQLEKQDHRCAICRKPQDQLPRRLSVDHDHVIGKNRGLLCDNCNPGLGKFQDSPELLRAAADYLESYVIVSDAH